MVPTKPNGRLAKRITGRAAIPRKSFPPSLYPLQSPLGPTRGMTMTTLVLSTVRQAPLGSGLLEVVLFSGVGLVLSLALVHFGVNLGTMG